MTEELDTSWFDLMYYNKLNDLNLYEWTEQIAIRNSILEDIEVLDEILQDTNILNTMSINGEIRNIVDTLKFDTESMSQRLMTNPIFAEWAPFKLKYMSKNDEFKHAIDHLKFDLGSLGRRMMTRPDLVFWPKLEESQVKYEFPCNTISVYGTPASAYWEITQQDKLSDIWELFNPERISDEITDDQLKLARTPINLVYRDRDISTLPTSPTHVTVELAATDKQIMDDFRKWLTEYRKIINHEIIKNSFTQSDFDYWIRYCIIPYIDLTLIAKYKGKKLTQNKLARLIFPNEYDIDIVGRIRQVTKPIAERLLKKNTCLALRAQILHENKG
jgi:hypothetical protein